MTSTLPVWCNVLFFGEIAIFLFGYFNIYVPKDQKDIAKRAQLLSIITEESEHFVMYKNRVSGIVCLLAPGLVIIACMIAFIMTDYEPFVRMIPNEALGHILAIIIMLCASIAIEGLSLLLMFVGEETAIRSQKTFYFGHYGVFLIDEEEYLKNHTKL